MTQVSNISSHYNSYTHSMTLTVECTRSTVKPLHGLKFFTYL